MKTSVLLSRKALQWGFACLLLLATSLVRAQSVPGTYTPVYIPEIIFKNPTLETGTAGADGAIYRFPLVCDGMDALVRISGRSSALVALKSIDIINMGHDKAFQPQVTYNNDKTTGAADWWMEFEISFVNKNTVTPADIAGFQVTGLDIDGNNDKINEWVSLYGLKSYTLEANSALVVSNIMETILGTLTTTGKKFTGPVTFYKDIDTSATSVMTTASYENANKIRIRTGATSTGASNASDRLYSFWFKGFSYLQPVQKTLPVDLISFSAMLNKSRVDLKWETENEKNLSHFMVERSTNGRDFKDAALVFAYGNTDTRKTYSFSDDVSAIASGIIYYRLQSVDEDGTTKYSDTRVIRVTDDAATNITLQVYPNPVSSEVRVTIPASWQGKGVTFQVFASNGQMILHKQTGSASQTETIQLGSLMKGVYWLRVVQGQESLQQQMVKN